MKNYTLYGVKKKYPHIISRGRCNIAFHMTSNSVQKDAAWELINVSMVVAHIITAKERPVIEVSLRVRGFRALTYPISVRDIDVKRQ